MSLSTNPTLDLEFEQPGGNNAIDFNDYYTDRGDLQIRVIDSKYPYPGHTFDWDDYVAYMEMEETYYDQNSITIDPLFNAPDSGDFSLQPGSPCIGGEDSGGDFLTSATNSGSDSTELTVADARYFSYGYSVNDLSTNPPTPVVGDLIQVGNNQPVRISSVDYTSNTITLSEARSWTIGAKVSYPYSDLKPNMGAH